MTDRVGVWLADAEATEAAGAALGCAWRAAGRPLVVLALDGDLGAGKTTLMRGLLRALGVAERVRSPTYTLVESYAPDATTVVHHLDCYRLQGWEALEALGLRDLLAGHALVAVEWANRVPALAARADLHVSLAVDGDGRRLRVAATSPLGATWLGALNAARRSAGNA